MRILVAGGAGYVGSHVVRALLEAGHEPVVYDNLATGHAESVSGAELILGDVADRELLGNVLQRRTFEGAVHLAAVSLVGESMKDPSLYFRNNVAAGLVFLDSLVSVGVPWVALSSTAAVYGDPEKIPIPEDHQKRPTNPYGDSKWMLERVLGWYERAYGLRSIALRYFNAAGAHPSGDIGEDHTPETHLIPIVLQAALGQREGVSVFGSDYATDDGTAVRDYVHVCDLASAHLRAMDWLHAGGRSGAFNLGSQHGYSVLSIIEAARHVTSRSIEATLAPRRAGDPPVLVADSRAAFAELGWSPLFGLREMLRTAWDWHSTHPYGYRH